MPAIVNNLQYARSEAEFPVFDHDVLHATRQMEEELASERSKGGPLHYEAYGNCKSLKHWQNRWTYLCALVGMTLKGSIDVAKKATEVARNSGICLDFI